MMPIYEGDQYTYNQLSDLRKRNVCAVCGGRLDLYQNFDNHKAFIACADWLRTHHEGIMREPSRYERGGVEEFTIEKRREIIMEEHGAEKTRALSRYMGPGVVMTKSTATEIVETLWGDAPVIEKTKCILLCQTYQLNPLAKHIHLIGYKRGDGHGGHLKDAQGNSIKDWSIQQGIGATRLLAHRKHNYSYLDLTPRRATKAEIEKVFGDEADPNSLYAFVHIKDVDTGAEVTALRGIPKNYKLKGVEKGNTLLNQVCIWSERLALDRQYPGEMPPGVEVVDERYEDVPDIGKVNKTTGEITEGEFTELNNELSTEPKPDFTEISGVAKEHWCREHNCPFEEKKSRYGSFWAHRTDDPKYPNGYCNEKKAKAIKEPKAPEPEPEPPALDSTVVPDRVSEPEPEPATGTLQELQETMALCNWSYADVGKYCNTERGWGINSLSDLKPDQLAEVVAHIKANPK